MTKALCLLLIFLGLAEIRLWSQSSPPLVNYQGLLTDEAGAALPDGTYRLAFRLYSNAVAKEGESLIWGREYDATLVKGAFSVILGADGGVAVPETAAVNNLAFAFTGAERFLELRVVRDNAGTSVNRTILPRQQLLSVPTALWAATVADGAVTTAKLAPGAVTGDAIGINAVKARHLADGELGADKLAAGLFKAATYSLGNNSPVSDYNTGYSTTEWYPVLTGFDYGAGDLLEHNTGDLGGVSFSEGDGSWIIRAGVRTHFDHSEARIQVLWISRRLVQ